MRLASLLLQLSGCWMNTFLRVPISLPDPESEPRSSDDMNSMIRILLHWDFSSGVKEVEAAHALQRMWSFYNKKGTLSLLFNDIIAQAYTYVVFPLCFFCEAWSFPALICLERLLSVRRYVLATSARNPHNKVRIWSTQNRLTSDHDKVIWDSCHNLTGDFLILIFSKTGE